MITFAGAEVVEVFPPKRRIRSEVPEEALETVRTGEGRGLEAVLALAGFEGVPAGLLPVVTGWSPERVEEGLARCRSEGAVLAEGRWVGAGAVREHRAAIEAAVRRVHREEPFRPGAPVESLRALAPTVAPRGLTDAVLAAAAEAGDLEIRGGVVSEAGFTPRFSPEQEAVRDALAETYRDAGLSPPTLDELPEAIRSNPAFLALVREMEGSGALVALEPDLLVDATALSDGIARTRELLGGAKGLGPADFREALPVSRRYLLPLLRTLDRLGVTRNSGDVREVPEGEAGP
jgi:selenocysteine-specific elongation factor